jgi:hypothetical protein
MVADHEVNIGQSVRHMLMIPVVVAACASAGATPVMVDPHVEREVTRGATRVLVEVRPPISRAQDEVLARLSGTDFRLVRRFVTSPLLALEIGPSALGALKTMGDVVVRVIPDAVVPPAGGSTPGR